MNSSTKMTIKDLEMLIRMLEVGMWENRLVQSLLDTLDSYPKALLPQAIGFVGYAAFLLTKVHRDEFALRALLACLTCCIECRHEDEYASTIIENIRQVLRNGGVELEAQDIRRLAVERNYGKGGKSESWTIVKGLGIRPGISSRLPLTTFKDWLKQLDPTVLNAGGRTLMEKVFSRFVKDSPSPKQYIHEVEHLRSLGVSFPQRAQDEIVRIRHLLDAGLEVEMRRHRRYAGGDGQLPRRCYSSVCSNAQGDDGGTLSRELMEYAHPCIPGIIFVGDSSDSGINKILRHYHIGVRPGHCILCVFICSPSDTEHRKVFNKVYSQILALSGRPDAPVHLHLLETRVDYVEIDNVIDLRLAETQAWFFSHFKSGDGTHLMKPNSQQIYNFSDMLPTLMHPELGGCGTTHGIGSWMRTTSPVNALIYPSARSDVTISVHEGQLVGFRGWNMVDYRGAAEIGSREIVTDYEPWYDFNQLRVVFNQPGEVTLDNASAESPYAGSWIVRGIQARYDALYRQIVK